MDILERLNQSIQIQLEEHPETHISTGMGCLMDHRKDGAVLPPCHRCGKCLQFIRPENMKDLCSGTHNPLEYHK